MAGPCGKRDKGRFAMREAKQGRRGKRAEFGDLQKRFRSDEVDTTQFGFYDQPSFIEREKANPAYLEMYAKWVLLRPLSEEYADHVRTIVPRVVALIARSLREDGWEGSCVAAAGLIARVLDRLRVWSFGLAGSTTFSVEDPPIWRGLYIVDEEDFPGAALGHSWICAPPYVVVDATAALQRWGNDRIRSFIPQTILDDVGKHIRPRVEDVVSSAIRAKAAAVYGRDDPNLHYRLRPDLLVFERHFRATQATLGPLTIRYVPVAVRQPDCSLEEINSTGSIGRTGRELWEQVIRPAFCG